MTTLLTFAAVSTPDPLRQWIRYRSRDAAVLAQSTCVSLDWWNGQIAPHPSGPIAAARGVTEGDGSLRRADVFRLAATAVSDRAGTGALRLFWHSMAWAQAMPSDGTAAQIASTLEDVGAGSLLREAALWAEADPGSAFRTLRSNEANTIERVGPEFFTAYLYFAGGGRCGHPSLMVNRAVLSTLHFFTDLDALRPTQTFDVGTYLAALETMQTWADDLSTDERPVDADEVERWAGEMSADGPGRAAA